MNTGFILSKRLLVASVFGLLIVGGALYINTHSKKPVVVAQTSGTKTNTVAKGAIDISAIQPTNATSTTAVAEGTPINETDILTLNTIGKYVQQNKTGSYTKKDRDSIVSNATKYMFTLEYTPLEPKDIKTTDQIDVATVSAYKNQLHEAIKPLFALTEYELTIYARAIRDNSKADFDKLSTIANVYKAAGDEVINIEAPRDVSAVHLAIINSLYKFSVILTELAKGYDDPAASLAGTGNFTQVEDEFKQAFSNLSIYFDIKNI